MVVFSRSVNVHAMPSHANRESPTASLGVLRKPSDGAMQFCRVRIAQAMPCAYRRPQLARQPAVVQQNIRTRHRRQSSEPPPPPHRRPVRALRPRQQSAKDMPPEEVAERAQKRTAARRLEGEREKDRGHSIWHRGKATA